jgi:ABC-type histidine transport system ATPase subunit
LTWLQSWIFSGIDGSLIRPIRCLAGPNAAHQKISYNKTTKKQQKNNKKTTKKNKKTKKIQNKKKIFYQNFFFTKIFAWNEVEFWSRQTVVAVLSRTIIINPTFACLNSLTYQTYGQFRKKILC